MSALAHLHNALAPGWFWAGIAALIVVVLAVLLLARHRGVQPGWRTILVAGLGCMAVIFVLDLVTRDSDPLINGPVVAYLGLGSLIVAAVLLIFTRDWTLLGMGLFGYALGTGVVRVASADIYYGWLHLTPGEIEVAASIVRAAWLVGMTAVLAGLALRVGHRHDGAPPAVLRSDTMHADGDDPGRTGLP